jgi:uncharacterized protein (TIGR03437 family)
MRTLAGLILLNCTAAWAGDPIVVSAADPKVGVTANSLASIYGDKLSTETDSAAALPLPTRLGDISVVWVIDSASNAQMASILFVSPTQLNVWIPAGMAAGNARIQFPFTGLPPGAGTAALRNIPVTINKVAPGLFSADGSGSGVAAASAVRVVISTQAQGAVPVVSCTAPGKCTAVPIDVGIDAPVYLSLFGTGIRGASALSNVSVTVGGTTIQPTYAGAQPEVPGLDQVNVPLPLSLRGAGLVDVTVSVDGVTSNAVQIRIQ